MRGIGRRVPWGSALVLSVILAAPPARAASVGDPDDVPGRLDLRRVAATLTNDPGPNFPVTIRTWTTWRSSVLAEDGPNRLFLLLDDDLDQQADARVRVLKPSGGGGLVARFCSTSTSYCAPDEPATRPDGRSVSFTIQVEPPNEDKQVAAKSRYFRNGSACDPACRDRAPNRGQWLGVPAAGGGGGG